MAVDAAGRVCNYSFDWQRVTGLFQHPLQLVYIYLMQQGNRIYMSAANHTVALSNVKNSTIIKCEFTVKSRKSIGRIEFNDYFCSCYVQLWETENSEECGPRQTGFEPAARHADLSVRLPSVDVQTCNCVFSLLKLKGLISLSVCVGRGRNEMKMKGFF